MCILSCNILLFDVFFEPSLENRSKILCFFKVLPYIQVPSLFDLHPSYVSGLSLFSTLFTKRSQECVAEPRSDLRTLPSRGLQAEGPLGAVVN